MDKLDRVIQVLSLVNSEKRDKTLQNIVLYILHVLGHECTSDNINDFIADEFGITFFKEELNAVINDLHTNGKIKLRNSKYTISSNISEEIDNAQRGSKEKAEILFKEFDEQISKVGAGNFSESKKRDLFRSFQEYLCECIYQFGRGSVNIFKRDGQDFQDKRLKVLKNVILKIKDKDEREVISSFIKNFPENLTTRQIDLITDLIERSEDFYSLGLSSEQVEELKKTNFLDWVLFLDTNVLYSILDLHVHPENEACQKILEILIENAPTFKIKLSYLQKTHKELQKKKQFFEQNIPRTTYSESQIRAMLNSQKIDSFTERYLQKMLNLGENTPHPIESIDRHITILKTKGIEINRKDLSGIDESSEYFMQSISDYKKVESILNEVRLEKTQQLKPPKDLEKVEHDIFLREAIKRFRILKPASLNDCKYFGLTLDSYLLKYDHHQLRRESQTSDILFPTFFRPSFLLSKLLKLVPIKTADYKKAFVKALLALSISERKRKRSKTVLKTVSRFNAMGLEDESIILACITDDFFLKKVEENTEVDQEDVLIRSLLEEKIEQKINTVRLENESLKEQLEEASDGHSRTVSDNTMLEAEMANLKIRRQQIEDDLRIYKKEYDKLRAKKDSVRKTDPPIQLSIEELILEGVNTPVQAGDNSASANNKTKEERIINWNVFKRRYYKFTKNIVTFLAIVNFAVALFLVILGCIDFDGAKTYFLVAAVGGVVAAVFKFASSGKLVTKLALELIVMFLFCVFIFFNSARISTSIKEKIRIIQQKDMIESRR